MEMSLLQPRTKGNHQKTKFVVTARCLGFALKEIRSGSSFFCFLTKMSVNTNDSNYQKFELFPMVLFQFELLRVVKKQKAI